jgi:cold shock CspA family protein
MTRGTVVSYDPDDETGFIMPDEEDDRIPFDRNSLLDYAGEEDPAEGDRVSYRVEGGLAGLWATHVRRID